MKKDQNLPIKNIQSINNSGKPLPNSYSNNRSQSPYSNKFRGRSPDRRVSRNYSQKTPDQIVKTIRIGISNRKNFCSSIYSNKNRICSYSNPRNRISFNDCSRNSTTTAIKIILTIVMVITLIIVHKTILRKDHKKV